VTTALSPDGRTLAVSSLEGNTDSNSKVRIFRVSTDGTGSRELFTYDGLVVPGTSTVAWDRDGRSILFSQMQSGAMLRSAVMRIPADGGAPSPVFVAPRAMNAFDISPDGSRIAYATIESPNELWALDNVLPMLK
jgi:Tol biopolymer transport system component